MKTEKYALKEKTPGSPALWVYVNSVENTTGIHVGMRLVWGIIEMQSQRHRVHRRQLARRKAMIGYVRERKQVNVQQ